MSFSTMLFLLLFLPVYLLFYYTAGSIHAKNIVLLVASLIFYAFGGIRYLLLLLVMAAAGWLAGILIEKSEGKPVARAYLILSVAVFLTVLGIFKYTGFFVGTLGAVLKKGWTVEIALPLGISFYTFKLISYAADVYHGRVEAERSYPAFLLYIASFHQVLQGPIQTYADMKKELFSRKVSPSMISAGIWRFSVGMAKKTILADHCGELADLLIPLSDQVASAPTLAVWIGSAIYTMQIYLDFSAYTDMAVGLGKMAGFHYPENFNEPYTAVSVKDFWRRWHMTLSSFFRDYVYIPLGGSRVSPSRTTVNLLVVWVLTGLWHGASWNFVLWGMFYFVLIVFENRMIRMNRKPWPVVLQHIYTIFVFNFGWLIFRFSDFGQLGSAVRGFFGLSGSFTSAAVRLNVMNNIWFLIFCVLACTPFFKKLEKYLEKLTVRNRKPAAVIFASKTVLAAVLLLLSLFMMTGSTYTPFLYNQF